MARKIYLSTSIFTSKTEDPFDGAIVVDGNEILYVGDREHAKEYEENAQIEDLGDRTVSPGLIDCHTHAYMGAKMSKLTSFFVPDGLSEKEVICAMKEFVASHSLKEGEVYLIFNYDFDVFSKLTKYKLDDLFGKDMPVALVDISLHGGAFSSKALDVLGYDPAAPIPEGTNFEQEEDGTLAYVSEALFFQIFAAMFSSSDDEDEIVDFAEELFLQQGVTTVADLLPVGREGIEIWNEDLYLKRQREGRLSMRVGVCTNLLASAEEWEQRRQTLNGDFVFHCGLKGFADGGFINSTAWITKPYLTGPRKGTYGGPANDMQLYRRKIKEANALGFPVRIHAEGDRAISEVITMYRESGNIEVLNQIEHATAMTEEVLQQIEDFVKKYKLMINLQPIFLYNEAASEERPVSCGIDFYNENAVRVKGAMQTGAMVSVGSTDYPATLPSVSAHIRVAVNRLADDETSYYYGSGYMTREAISLRETLVGMTKSAAKAIGKSECLGLIEKGYKADLTIFDSDLFAMKPEDYKTISIYKTVVDGKEVYTKNK